MKKRELHRKCTVPTARHIIYEKNSAYHFAARLLLSLCHLFVGGEITFLTDFKVVLL